MIDERCGALLVWTVVRLAETEALQEAAEWNVVVAVEVHLNNPKTAQGHTSKRASTRTKNSRYIRKLWADIIAAAVA